MHILVSNFRLGQSVYRYSGIFNYMRYKNMSMHVLYFLTLNIDIVDDLNANLNDHDDPMIVTR